MKPTTQAPDDEPGNANIDNMAPLDGMADSGLILTARGLARCNSAISAMEALTTVLFHLEIDKDCTGGIQANTRTTSGLIRAMAVCAGFLSEHLNGGLVGIYTKTVIL
jgi:hypothetical protein